MVSQQAGPCNMSMMRPRVQLICLQVNLSGERPSNASLTPAHRESAVKTPCSCSASRCTSAQAAAANSPLCCAPHACGLHQAKPPRRQGQRHWSGSASGRTSHLQLLCVLVGKRPPNGVAPGQRLVVREGAVVGIVHGDGGQWSHLQWQQHGDGQPVVSRSAVHSAGRLGATPAGAGGPQVRGVQLRRGCVQPREVVCSHREVGS